MGELNTVRIWADGVVLVVFAIAATISLQAISSPTYWFPAFVTVSGVVAAGYNLVADVVRARSGRSLTEGEIVDIGASVADGSEEAPSDGRSVRRRVLELTCWFVALPLLALVVPFFYAALVWLVALLRFQAGSGGGS